MIHVPTPTSTKQTGAPTVGRNGTFCEDPETWYMDVAVISSDMIYESLHGDLTMSLYVYGYDTEGTETDAWEQRQWATGEIGRTESL